MIIRSSIFSVHMNVWMLDIHKRRSVLNINENLTEKSTRGFKKKVRLKKQKEEEGRKKWSHVVDTQSQLVTHSSGSCLILIKIFLQLLFLSLSLSLSLAFSLPHLFSPCVYVCG